MNENSNSIEKNNLNYDNYVLADVGANITNRKFVKDVESVIRRAKEAGVRKIIIPGCSLRSCKEAIRLANFHSGTVYAAVGIHPHSAKLWEDTHMSELREMGKTEECVAIGECGLDYTKDYSPPEMQRDIFEQQVALACELQKPLLLHEKGAHRDMLEILERFKDSLPTIIFHSFTGSYDEGRTYLKLKDSFIAVTGYLCKDAAISNLQKLLVDGSLTLDRVVVESDAPFLYPNSRSTKLPPHVKNSFTKRSVMYLERYCTFQRNEPCSLPIVVEMIAGLIGKPAEEVALTTAYNALKIFNVSP